VSHLAVKSKVNYTCLDRAVLATWLQSEYSECFGDHHALLAIVRRWYTFIKLEPFESCGSPGSFVRHHATDGTVEDFGRSTVVERSGLLGINDMPLV
jgi:hypothetical protein